MGSKSTGSRMLRLCTVTALACLTVTSARADFAAMIKDMADSAMAEYRRIDAAAKATVARERGDGTCAARAAGLSARLDEAVRLARLSADIYNHPQTLEMKRQGVTRESWRDELDRRVTAYRDPVSEGYAEVVEDGDTLIVVFLGTRLVSFKDVMTDVAQMSGTLPVKYRWASALVEQMRQRFPGQRLVVTGHSLGGGLSMYAALHHPVEAVAFNPAGLSPVILSEIPAAQQVAAGQRTASFIARSGAAIEPVSAVSLAGDTSIVGRRYLVDIGTVLTPLKRHDAFRLANTLESLAARKGSLAASSICDNDLGFERH